ncbi:hypothetical protein ACFLX5_06235 [Chloroflexota bacterium]
MKLLALVLGIFAVLTVVLSVLLFTQGDDLQQQVKRMARPYAFDFAAWEIDMFPSVAKGIVFGQYEEEQGEELVGRIRIVLEDEGIRGFPPLAFSFGETPYLLVVSPRDRIAYYQRVLLRLDMTVEEAEGLEYEIDGLGMSSLVVGLGGFAGIYPAPVAGGLSLRWTIETAVEEWLHQSLAFKSLGFEYILDSIGIDNDTDIVTINETLVGMVSSEITDRVISQYYADVEDVPTDEEDPGFDFDAEMRETRRNVDRLLEEGKVEQAEGYMEERRLVFLENGYYIRKLNQAYFAFHGIYGTSPVSVSPIYADLEELRARSQSPADFLDEVSDMKSYGDLKEALDR